MAESTVRDLFRSLEQTLHERLRVIEDVLRYGMKASYGGDRGSDSIPKNEFSEMMSRMKRLEETLSSVQGKLEKLEAGCGAGASTGETARLYATRPLEGIEIVGNKKFVIHVESEANVEPLSIANRLLLNKTARKALEAQEMGVTQVEDHAELEETEETEEEVVEETQEEGEVEETEEEVVEETEEEVVEETEEGEVEETEEEVVEETEEGEVEETEEGEVEETEEEVVEETEEEVVEETEEEEGEVELEEFEYKGSTYYRDGENNVFMLDENGELVEEPIGVWSEVKKRIVVRKPAA